MNQPEPRRGVDVTQTVTPDHTTVAFDGVLDGTTYLLVRDAIVKAALDSPALVIVDVSKLHVPSPSAWSVFTSARWLVVQWPDVAIALVCSHSRGRSALARNGIPRYVPVYGDLGVAVAAMASNPRPLRRRARRSFAASPSAAMATRVFVSDWLDTWSLENFSATARVIATVLVDNVLRHTDDDPDVRVETDGLTVTVAVTDHCPTQACLQEGVEVAAGLNDLQIVSALSRAWGNTPTANGKVVWVVLGPENCL